ncbi:hypothetical protein N8T08_004309 [Aspergillus melleus]|uniref:Uncharacterized protein n=1 Tax=Aspergillus melleus TaxID=138277 RepID=A0ACC3B519_9EURO|nr:hypothetical protein N8T08_004309 [Aspergillus melleus]
MSNSIQAQIARRHMNRFFHFQSDMVPPTGALQNLTLELHVACLRNDADRVTQLMSMGAKRDALNESGASALEVAEQLNRTNIVKCLMANVDVEKEGVLELLYAIRRGQSTVVRALMEMGVKQQLQDEVVFRGVFLMACAISNPLVVNALLRYGPGLNVAVFEEIFVRIARTTSNLATAEFIQEICDEQRRRGSRADRATGQLPTSNSLDRMFNEIIEMPQSSGVNVVEEEKDKDEYW